LFAFVLTRYSRMRLYIGFCLVIAIVGVLLVWRAPGNTIRAGQFHFDRSIVKVILMSHLQILRFAADWISDLPFIFLSIVVVIRAGTLNTRWIDSIKLWWIGLALYLVMLLCIILPYWFTGVLGQQRTVNMSYYFFLPLIFLILVKISRSRFVFNILSLMSSDRIITAMVVAAIIFMAITKNGYKLGYDIAYGILPKYKAEQIAREELLRNNLHNDSFKLEPVQNRPLSITLYDERNPKFYWAEKCEKEYLLKKEELLKR
ncbi:MAG: hypothetical protein JWO03_425, partial [Bacteroidetes bacterium]|nr:hypothetical protein [Bacteroidota bacterium]